MLLQQPCHSSVPARKICCEHRHLLQLVRSLQRCSLVHCLHRPCCRSSRDIAARMGVLHCCASPPAAECGVLGDGAALCIVCVELAWCCSSYVTATCVCVCVHVLHCCSAPLAPATAAWRQAACMPGDAGRPDAALQQQAPAEFVCAGCFLLVSAMCVCVKALTVEWTAAAAAAEMRHCTASQRFVAMLYSPAGCAPTARSAAAGARCDT